MIAIPHPDGKTCKIIREQETGSQPPLTPDEELILALHTELEKAKAERDLAKRERGEAILKAMQMFNAIKEADDHLNADSAAPISQGSTIHRKLSCVRRDIEAQAEPPTASVEDACPKE